MSSDEDIGYTRKEFYDAMSSAKKIIDNSPYLDEEARVRLLDGLETIFDLEPIITLIGEAGKISSATAQELWTKLERMKADSRDN